LLARAFLRAGDPSGARTAIADALQWTERTDQRYLLAELLRIDAEVLALGGDRAAADITCRRALDVASEQDSSWLRGRAQATFDRLGAPGA
jgi:hypothetical protein